MHLYGCLWDMSFIQKFRLLRQCVADPAHLARQHTVFFGDLHLAFYFEALIDQVWKDIPFNLPPDLAAVSIL